MKKVVVASAPWCQNCNVLKKSLTSAGITYEEINVDINPEFAKTNMVRGLPTTIIYDNDVVVERVTGAASIEQIKKVLEG